MMDEPLMKKKYPSTKRHRMFMSIHRMSNMRASGMGFRLGLGSAAVRGGTEWGADRDRER